MGWFYCDVLMNSSEALESEQFLNLQKVEFEIIKPEITVSTLNICLNQLPIFSK